jgi:hypothetical protein
LVDILQFFLFPGDAHLSFFVFLFFSTSTAVGRWGNLPAPDKTPPVWQLGARRMNLDPKSNGQFYSTMRTSLEANSFMTGQHSSSFY